MSPSCIFCEISKGTAHAAVVVREGGFTAFLDARPVFKGHVLVVPTDHVAVIADLPEESVGPLFSLVRRVSAAIETGLGSGGTFLCLNNKVSQSVPHIHVHVVPRTKGDGLRGFLWPRTKYASDDETQDYARRISAALK
ncbi:MAG: HIT family protein [Myxococcales bacterium]|nr:HIT family protein [Myxococcales bacterium]